MATTQVSGYVPLVAIRRGGVVESVHHGAIAVVGESGRLLAATGDPTTVTFPRSAAKPVQVLPLLESGGAERFGLTGEEIAVMIGSHGGEPEHLEAVRSILRKIGLDEKDLQCGVHAPMHAPAARALRAAGRTPTVLHNNCSGKHAGMLALAVVLNAGAASYLDPDHPAQVRIRAAMGAFSGLREGALPAAVDGCSAPTYALPLDRAALMYARLLSPDGVPEAWRRAARGAVAAMRAHPFMVAGTDRLCTTLLEEAGASLVAKVGAEGFYGMGFVREGRGIGIAIKIADGDTGRARNSAALRTLERLGALDPDRAVELRRRFVGALKNRRGIEVGGVETVFDLQMQRRGLVDDSRSDAHEG